MTPTRELRDALELDRHSRVLMFSTEGNTDPEKYRRVVWDGEYPTDDTAEALLNARSRSEPDKIFEK